MNLPEKLCPQGHFARLYDVEKLRYTIWDGSKSAAAGRQKFMPLFLIAPEFALLYVEKEECRRLSHRFYLSMSGLFAFLVSSEIVWCVSSRHVANTLH